MLGKGTKLSLEWQEESWQWRDHRIVYTVAGEGTPLFLQHSINGGAWAFEMRRQIGPLSKHYRVYAADLPGFGRSERKPITYTAEIYIDFMADFARYIMEKEGQPPAGIVSSLAAAFTIGALGKDPEAFGPMMLISPTGLERLQNPPSEKQYRFHKVLMGPVGTGIFKLITTRRFLRYFLSRDAYIDKNYITPEIVDGFHLAARKPNAKYAPISFLSFLLNHNVEQEWPNIKQPVLIVWGSEAKTTPPENAELFLRLRPGTELKVFDHSGLSVYDEKAEDFNELALDWLGKVYQKQPA